MVVGQCSTAYVLLFSLLLCFVVYNHFHQKLCSDVGRQFLRFLGPFSYLKLLMSEFLYSNSVLCY